MALRLYYFYMKKYFLSALVFLMAARVLNAQEVVPTDNDTPRQRHWSVGLTGGMDRNYHIVDMSYMTDYDYSKYAPGTSFGIQFSYSPVKWLSFRLDGVMLNKNYYRDHVHAYSQVQSISLPDTTINQYFNAPLVVRLNVGNKVRLHLFGGGYVGYWLTSFRSGRTQGMNSVVSYFEQVDFWTVESQRRDNRLDAGFVYGAGVSTLLLNRIELGVEARYYYGVTDIQKNYMAHLNPRYNSTFVLQGGLSYWF